MVKVSKVVTLRADGETGAVPQKSLPKTRIVWGEPSWENYLRGYGVPISSDRPISGLVPRVGEIQR